MRFVLALSLLLLAGCGTDNVEVCEDWAATVSCGDFDASTAITCSVYERETCDLTEYFTCLTDNLQCDESTDPATANVDGWEDCWDLDDCDATPAEEE
jgi:hypothetical protein